MNEIIYSYIGIVIVQVCFIRYYLTDWERFYKGPSFKKLEYNENHEVELDNFCKDILLQRIKMLDTMSYQDWLDYNNKNCVLKREDNEYYLAAYEQITNSLHNQATDNEYIMRVNAEPDSLGMTYGDLLKQDNYAFLFSSFTPNPNLVKNMFDMTHDKNEINNLSYYWLDPLSGRATKKKAIVGVWKKQVDNNRSYEGVILMGYGVKDIEIGYANKYYEFMSTPFLVLTSLATIISSLILYFSTKKRDIIKPLILLFSVNIYLMFFMNTTEGITTLAVEQDKVKDINDGILSISFLVAVNIFIIETLKKFKQKYSLHNESAFLFCLSLVLLLLSLYKKTNYSTINDMRAERIQKQLMFNLSIFINLFILINYLIFVGGDAKLIKLR